MRFFDRKQEIAKLQRIEKQSFVTAQFTVVSGRRRIGKTMLIREAYKEIPMLFFLLHVSLKATSVQHTLMRWKEFWEFLFLEHPAVLLTCLGM